MKGGQFVREARRRAAMTQEQLAARSGVSQATIARIEQGAVSPSLDRIHSLVRAAGFDLEIHVVPIDDDAWVLTQQNLSLTPDERVGRMLDGLRLRGAANSAQRDERDA
ncbi:MAG TPA: helix-turn-helix transcriptional regulator [Actinomycetota bacterium]